MLKVHSYESLGTYDGPGIRLVVFLQGCNFACLYCANPDTIECKGGKETEDGEIVRRALNEKAFFGKRGGVTFSGGEPTMQAKDLIPVVERLKAEGIHVCIDTNGSVWNADVEKLLNLCDLVLLDVKEFNPERHRRITGHDNSRTLQTAEWLECNGKPFWLRYVLVPGLSDFREDIEALGGFFGKSGDREGFKMLQRVEILPYHTLGKHKYEVIGKAYALEGTPLNTPEQLEAARAIFEKYFDCVMVN